MGLHTTHTKWLVQSWNTLGARTSHGQHRHRRTLGNGNVHCYNTPTANEVAMIIHGELGEVGNRDVIVQRRYGGGLQWMNELAPSYDPL